MPPKDETPEQVKEWLQTALRKIWPLAEVRIIQGQLLNQHRHQLSPTAESSRVPLGLEEITLPVFPSLPRYGLRAGRGNPNSLSPEMIQTQLLDLLCPYADRVALLIFEFGASIGRAFDGVNSFAEALSKFFASLPTLPLRR